MLEITNEVISFTKGDSVAFAVDLKNADGTTYEMRSGDRLKMTIRKSVSEDVVFNGSTPTPNISIPPTTTTMLNPGKYCYDIELNTADGGVYTIVGIRKESDRNLVVYPEVTTADE